MENKKVVTNGNVWFSLEEYKLWEEYYEKLKNDFAMHVIWGVPYPIREPKPEDNIKLALVDGNKMIGVDVVTKEGYEVDDKTPTVKIPLVKTEYKVFERWVHLMDV